MSTQVGEASVALKFDTKDAASQLKSDVSSAAKSAEGSFTVFKGVMANLATQGVNAALSAVSSVGRGIVSVGKDALASYADYEQLVGGVDTLFKDASKTVQNSAKIAFRTAGLSANKYMETVTNFSASLLQGLGGDTEQAAKIADMAVQDMSDNVNKMGTDMSLVQYAYQGFAKQNFTMLDNLKLGYGGSASEMARLINESGVLNGEMKVTAENVRNVPFDKMIEAIHVVQDEMGITGTTAKEASDTISGSVSMAKSAWENLVTGIADDNADWARLVDDLVQSILTAARNILPRVGQIVHGIVELASSFVHDVLPPLISEVAPMIIELIPAALDAVQTVIATIAGLIPEYLPQIIDGIMKIAEMLIDNLPAIVDVGLEIILALIEGITKALPRLAEKLPDIIEKVADVLIDNFPLIYDAGLELMVVLVDAIVESIPKLIEKTPQIIERVVWALIQAAPKLLGAANEMMNQLATGILDSAGAVLVAIATVINDVVGSIIEFVAGVVDSVVGVIKPFVDEVVSFVAEKTEGIRTKVGEVIDAIVSYIVAFPGRVVEQINAVKDFFVNAFNAAKDWVSNRVNDIVNFITSIPGRVAGKINEIKDRIVNAFNNAKDAAKGRVDSIVSFVTGIPGRIGGRINEIKDKFVTAFEEVKRVVKDAVDAVVDFILSIPGRIGDIGGQIGGAISSGVGGAIEGAKGAISDLLSNIPGLATGGYVHATPGGTLAVIGEGGEDEFVIPRSQMIDILTGVATRPLPELKAENMRVDGGGIVVYNTYEINSALDADDIGRRINNSIRLATL